MEKDTIATSSSGRATSSRKRRAACRASSIALGLTAEAGSGLFGTARFRRSAGVTFEVLDGHGLAVIGEFKIPLAEIGDGIARTVDNRNLDELVNDPDLPPRRGLNRIPRAGREPGNGKPEDDGQ